METNPDESRGSGSGAAPENERRLFAANLRARRKELGLTQPEVAEQMATAGFRYHIQTVSADEAGQRKIDVAEAAGYARIYGTTIEQLLMPTDEQNTVAWFDDFTGRADTAYESIASGTRQLLFAREHLEHGIATMRGGVLESERVQASVRGAQSTLEHATPERAVLAGRQDHAEAYPEAGRVQS